MPENKLNVLIAEPDELASQVMAEVIMDEGHNCTIVTSSEEAYEALSKPFDVLFLHRGIDKINIESIARYARGISYIPVIILISSQSPKVAEVDRLKVDADAVIFKPLDMPDIINVLNISKKTHRNLGYVDDSIRLLIVSEEQKIISEIKSFLTDYTVDEASDSNTALKMVGNAKYDIIVSETFVTGTNGIELIQSAKNINPFIWSIIISESMNLDIAIAALKEGVNDIIEKPIKSAGVVQAIEKARRTIKLENDKRKLLFDLQSKTKSLEESNSKLHSSETLVLKLHQKTLQQLEELSKFQKIIEYSGDAIYVIDVETFLFKSANSRASQMLGYTNEELLKLGPRDIDPTYPIQTEAEKNTFIEHFIKNDKPFIFATYNSHKNGTRIPVEVSAILQEVDNKKYFLAIVRDITDRKAKEEELKKLSHVVEQSPTSVLITNLKGVVEYANPSYYKTFGLESTDVLNRPVELIFSEMNYQNTYHDILASAFEGNIWKGQTFCTNKHNKKIWLRVVISPVKNEFNENANFVIIQEDVSQRVLDAEKQKEQEKHMIESSRLATLGTLVAGIGHEINNPNNFILMNGATLKRMWDILEQPILNTLKQNPQANTTGKDLNMIIEKFPLLLSDISAGSERIKNIVSELRTFARKDDFDYNQSVNINEIVVSACKIINSVITNSTNHFTIIKAADLPLIKGNAQRLEQVFICFIQNACQALKDKNSPVTVTIGFCNETNRVKAEIKDSGTGIPKDILEKIFDPFFTTKRGRGGTGMGLSIAKSILDKHNGVAEVESVVNVGTTVTIYLPRKK